MFPMRLRIFLDKYGPFIVDVLLALPFVRLFRTPLTRYRNVSRIKQNRPSICRLPDELILEICSVVDFSGPQIRQWHPYCRSWISDSALALLSFSMTSKRMRDICMPLVFKHVSIGHHGHHYGWRRAFRSLKPTERSQAPQHCTTFTVFIDPGYKNISHPPKRFPPRLALSLQKYDRVRNLKVEIPNYSAAAFQKAFERIDVNLPSVRVLILSSHLEWLIRMCPDVEIVSTSGTHWLTTFNDTWPIEQPSKLIRAAGRAPKLQHFEMHGHWGRDLVQTVLKVMPNVQSLAMLGRNYEDSITTVICRLQRLRNLKTLILDDPSALGVGYDPPRCGNAYDGPDGEQYMEYVEQQRWDAVAYIGKLVFGRLESLQELWVGDHDKATRRLNDSGTREIVWTHEHRQGPSGMYR